MSKSNLCTVLVPMYNEEKRLRCFLPGLVDFVRKNSKQYKLMLVNDGSNDGTLNLARELTKGVGGVEIVTYEKNKGKGGAVRTGIMRVNTPYVLFIDADGSIKPNEIPRMFELLDKYDMVIGTRRSEESDVDQVLSRRITSFMFNTTVKVLFRIGVKDFLCGFKGFKTLVAKELFKGLISFGWVFDVEILYRARKKGFSIYELPIHWVHMEDSKMKLTDPPKIFLSLLKLRIKI